MKKRYGAIFATLFLCIGMHAQDFQPMEYNGLLYQELACNVADKEDAALVVRILRNTLGRITCRPISLSRNVRKTASGMAVTANPGTRKAWRI